MTQISFESAAGKIIYETALRFGLLSKTHCLIKCVDEKGVTQCSINETVVLQSNTLFYSGQMFVLKQEVVVTNGQLKAITHRFGKENEIITFFMYLKAGSTRRCGEWSKNM